MNPTSAVNKEISNEECYQISDDDDDNNDVEDFEDLGDECLLEEVDSSSSINGNALNVAMNNTRGPYERAWTTEATRALIHIRGPLEGRFTEGRQKRTALWLHCTRQLQRLGHRYSAAKVQKKWHNILITYNKNLNKKYTTGYVHWEFFEDMFKHLQGKKADCDTVLQLAPPPPLTARQPLNSDKMPTSHHQSIKIRTRSTDGLEQQQQQQQQQHAHQYQRKIHEPNIDKKSEYDDEDDDEDEEDSITLAQLKKPKLDISLTYLPPPPSMEYMNGNGSGGNYVVDQNAIDARLEQQHDAIPPSEPTGDWWREYFEQKLQVEREKIQVQRDIHNDIMQFKQAALVQEERVERLKIDAINGLTGVLQKLADIRCKKS